MSHGQEYRLDLQFTQDLIAIEVPKKISLQIVKTGKSGMNLSKPQPQKSKQNTVIALEFGNSHISRRC